MAHMIFCDVCEKPFSIKEWMASPGIEATIPPALLGDLEVDTDDYTFCSWECLARLVERYASDDDKQPGEEEVVEQEEPEPAKPSRKPRKAAEPEVPPTGVYFPNDMKVDGRPVGQLRRQ